MIKPFDTNKLNEWVKAKNTPEFTYKAYCSGGLIETPKGVVLAEDDAVHYEPSPASDTMNVYFYKETNLADGKIGLEIVPSLCYKVPMNEMPLLPGVPLKQYFCKGGSRRASNYKELLSTLKESGYEE